MRPMGDSVVSSWKILGQMCSGIQNFLDFRRVIGYLYYVSPQQGLGQFLELSEFGKCGT